MKTATSWSAASTKRPTLLVRSLDKTADAVHVLLDVGAALADDELLALVSEANRAEQIDRDLFKKYLAGLTHGNHAVTVVAFEMTGRWGIERFGGLWTDTIFGRRRPVDRHDLRPGARRPRLRRPLLARRRRPLRGPLPGREPLVQPGRRPGRRRLDHRCRCLRPRRRARRRRRRPRHPPGLRRLHRRGARAGDARPSRGGRAPAGPKAAPRRLPYSRATVQTFGPFLVRSNVAWVRLPPCSTVTR